MTIDNYIDNINNRYKLGNATEHTFRGDLQQLIENLVPDIRATNEPKRQKCGAPDYILTKKDIPVGFIEAKDIGDKDLEGSKKSGNKEQFDRYKASLNNLIFTDYMQFYLYREGQFVTKIAIAELSDKGLIKPLPENFLQFTNLIKDFCSTIGQTIKSSKKLAEMMAGKARLLSDVIEKALNSDEINQENSTLKDQMEAFKQILIHDINPKSFADVYAQTIAYGMFAARYHDPTLPTFSRQEAYELIPKSNPFLKKLFGYIAGLDVDDRIKWIVDDLVNIFLACDVCDILKDYGKGTKMEDPIIHFYETFLSKYDPALRKARGVWYTPQPVVNFIVRAVDDILKTEFDLPQGLADTSKTKIKVDVQGKKVDKEIHKVQILDPATGTGTFLAEVLKHIHKKFEGQQGIWSNYVENHLLPRLNGFELLMASYAMAHLKLDLLLTETGYKPAKNQRLRVFLTNSLEEHHPDTGTLWANWLSTEANEANHIKRDTSVMCVIGNPPYNGESSNKGKWIMDLMDDYKKEPGGKEKLKERNPKWINDDYVKFLRYGQHFIEKNGSGILAFINPHGFLDNPTFRGMRWNLLKTYDKIYILNLHGNSRKSETTNDGSIDENVFDIMQGVSINIFFKTGKKKPSELGKVFYYDLLGKREFKNDFLDINKLASVPYKEIIPKKPMYYMIQKDFDIEKAYNKGFSVSDIFPVNSVGIVTARDNFAIHKTKNELNNTIKEFLILDDETARRKFELGKDVRDWQVNFAKKDLHANYPNENKITKINYRPFDFRFTFFTGKSKGFHCYPRTEVMQHFFNKDNIGLVSIRRSRSSNTWNEVFVSKEMISGSTCISSLDINYAFPLYIFRKTRDTSSEPMMLGEDNDTSGIVSEPTFVYKGIDYKPNLDHRIVSKIEDSLGIGFIVHRIKLDNKKFSEIDILDYIYAVLHSPTYREKYKEFLKIDFPRVPYPKDVNTFWQLVKLGGEIRQIHLLESPTVEKYITQYPVDGNNMVTKLNYQNGKVYINETQYFDNVPEIAWNFYIGGYQPAQKWLKDRKDRKLEFEDILHYQKIIVALTETDRIMKEIDKIEIV